VHYGIGNRNIAEVQRAKKRLLETVEATNMQCYLDLQVVEKNGARRKKIVRGIPYKGADSDEVLMEDHTGIPVPVLITNADDDGGVGICGS
jgi:hypothetical protein